MENKPAVYRKLFFSTLKLSAFTFGGGFVIVPLMRRRFVEELGWLEEQEMLDITALSQSSPGPIAVNASILIGYRVAGLPGALMTVLGTVLPPLVIISVISWFYQAFRDNPLVNVAMTGMLAGVAAVLCDVVITMTAKLFKQKRILPFVILAGAFVASRVFGVNIMLIIAACGLIGACDLFIRRKHEKGGQK